MIDIYASLARGRGGGGACGGGGGVGHAAFAVLVGQQSITEARYCVVETPLIMYACDYSIVCARAR